MAGLIIGPSVLGFVAPEPSLHLIAEIGILLLLFEVGLETDVGLLVKEGVRSTLVAFTGVVVLAVVYDVAVKGSVSILATLRILAFITVFLLLAPVIAKLFVPLMAKLSASSRIKGMIPTLMMDVRIETTLPLIVCVSVLAGVIGVQLARQMLQCSRTTSERDQKG